MKMTKKVIKANQEKGYTAPVVRIEYAWLLSDAASTILNEKWGDGTPLRSYEEYVAIAEKYDAWWQPESEKILAALCEITGLEFRQNIIDVYVAPWFYAFSVPMVIGVIFKTKDDLIRVLAHEITHRLLTDNTTYEYFYKFLPLWRKMFGMELPFNTVVHIPVHAIIEKLCVEYLERPDLVVLDKERVAENPPYKQAWEYVEEHGSEAIIAQLREHAATMRSDAA